MGIILLFILAEYHTPALKTSMLTVHVVLFGCGLMVEFYVKTH